MIRLALALCLVLAACQPIPAPAPPPRDADASEPIVGPPPPDASGGTDDAKRPTALGMACAVLAAFGCPEGKPTPKGETCEQVFGDVARFPGLTPAFDPGCVGGAKTLGDVRFTCHVKCPQ